MRRETQIRHGTVPDNLGGCVVKDGYHCMDGHQFLLRGHGFACYYSKGAGVTVQIDDAERTGELELHLAGTVHAAIACINGLYPLHASAVVAGGRVFAISGPTGAGKSTLAAALARRGFALFADDVLTIDLSTDPPSCLPGHKRMKLWPEGLKLAGAEAMGLVSPDYPKYFVTSKGSEVDGPLPLGAILFLEQGPETQLCALHGGERLTHLRDGHYTTQMFECAMGDHVGELFILLANLANAAPFYRFIRPFEPGNFEDMLDFIGCQLERIAGK